jgi:hypothetical protein
MPICISCIAFVTEVLRLHQENIRVNIQIKGTPTNMFAMVHHILKERGIFMPLAHAVHSRYNVQNEKEVLEVVHGNPSTST